MKKPFINNRGMSMVEALLSVALFAVFATGLIGAWLLGQEATMTSGNKIRAIHLAEEGLEASRNIRDSLFSNLSAGTSGFTTTSNQWNLSGTSDTNGIYTRSATVTDIDSNRKNVITSVTWQQNAQRTGTTNLVTRLTYWQKSVSLSIGSLLIYGNGTNIPKYRTYDSTANTFSSESSATTTAIGRNFVIRTSPTNSEAVVAYTTTGGAMDVLCFDGTTWTRDWTTTVGGTGTTRRFDVAYETNSGDVMVLYSKNVGTTNELAYRTKLGSAGCGAASWSAEVSLDPVRTSGVVHWVKMAWDRRASSNLITAIWADVNSDLSAMVWSGTAWSNEPSAASETSLEVASTAQDVEDFDVEYESTSGDVMLVWANSAGSNGTNGVRYRTCTGGISSCTWNAVTTPPTFSDDATNLDISANPNSDEIVFASVGDAGRDLQIGYWSGSAWTNTANVDTSCNTPAAGSRRVVTGWLVAGATTRSIVEYGDQGSNAIDWYVGNSGTFTKQTDVTISPAPNNPNGTIDIQMNPMSTDQLMFLIADNNSNLFAKRLVMTSAPAFTWTNSDGAVLQATLPGSTVWPFSFAFSRN